MRKTNLAVLAVALVMGLGAAVLVRNWLLNVGHSTETVVAATQSLAFGTELTSDNVAEIEWAAGKLPEGAFVTKQNLLKDGGRVVLTPIERNEPILASKITGPGQRGSLSTLLKGDMRAVTVRVDDVRGVAGFVLPGDRVDVVLIRSGAGDEQNYADVIVQNVRVLAVDQKANERPDKANVIAKAVTLAVNSEDAQKILLATNIGKLSLTLREPGQTGAEAIRRITERDLVLTTPVGAAKSQAPAARNSTVVIIHGMKAQEYPVTQGSQHGM